MRLMYKHNQIKQYYGPWNLVTFSKYKEYQTHKRTLHSLPMLKPASDNDGVGLHTEGHNLPLSLAIYVMFT